MTWKLHADGKLSEMPRHNWVLSGDRFVCAFSGTGRFHRRFEVDCHGCGKEVTSEDLVATFGFGPGLIEPEMVDAVHAGIFRGDLLVN